MSLLAQEGSTLLQSGSLAVPAVPRMDLFISQSTRSWGHGDMKYSWSYQAPGKASGLHSEALVSHSWALLAWTLQLFREQPLELITALILGSFEGAEGCSSRSLHTFNLTLS